SPRRDKSLVVFDCAAVAPNLIHAELFGVVRGAFTGADRDRSGAFQDADEGTLFLDELGELPLDLQTSLLRALERKEVKRLGAGRYESVNVRVVATRAQAL